MTIDEELAILEDNMRRLKIEYDMYFGGGSKRPPYDLQWRVESSMKRMEGGKITYTQRFKLNSMAQKHAVFSDMWRQRVKRREEGRETPGGRRVDVPIPPPPPPVHAAPVAGPSAFKVQWQDPDQEQEKVGKLFEALIAAKKHVGENLDTISIGGFQRFVKQKTEQLKRDQNCQHVEYAVEVENGQVRLKAKGT